MGIPLSHPDVAAMLARRKPGFTLEAPFYTSREIFDLDLDLIFGRHWVFVGSEPEVPEPGDFVTVQVGRSSVILVRDDDMSVRAFHNVCRHRGSKILLDQ
jgi:Rieske 2Fe-2S family protein